MTSNKLSLRLQINLIVAALTFLFAATVLALQLGSMRDSVHEEVVAANRVASQLLQRTVWRYAPQGMPAMLAFLEGMGRVRSNEITLFDHQGREVYRSPAPTYKAGRDAPEWFTALIAPAPSVQSIEFPDGKLVVRANASRAEIDAWDYIVALVGGALVLLIVVNLAVYWLVGRAVRPFGQIVQALNQLQSGRFDAALPPLRGTEAAAIGAAFNRMVAELQTHIETERRAVRAELQLSDSRELTRWIDHHIEAERKLIARELHDELGQSVTAVRSMALSIANRTRATDPQSEAAARVIAEESSRLYDAMHGIIPRLTPLVLDNFGLAEALNDLAERTRRLHPGVVIELGVNLGEAVLSADATLALYRAAQEGMTNALRHGHAKHLQLTVTLGDGDGDGDGHGHGHGDASAAQASPDRITHEAALVLIDDGQGLPPEGWQRAGHYGLRWLDERVQGLGGRFEITGMQQGGVRLSVRVPTSLPPTSAASSATASAESLTTREAA